ncbi:unnamed protein product [Parnassius apollo]|uniref:(apollo) hypothetical protein n=1 Tax=Parnassius apollo TaxID=110799 RepID=A0A8S3X4C5_PARAO|nr:unnamed protein product [Parnassius apollo]
MDRNTHKKIRWQFASRLRKFFKASVNSIRTEVSAKALASIKNTSKIPHVGANLITDIIDNDMWPLYKRMASDLLSAPYQFQHTDTANNLRHRSSG